MTSIQIIDERWRGCPNCRACRAYRGKRIPKVGEFVICRECGVPLRVRYAADASPQIRFEGIPITPSFGLLADKWAILRAVLWMEISRLFWVRWWERLRFAVQYGYAVWMLALGRFVVFRRLVFWRHWELRRVGFIDVSTQPAQADINERLIQRFARAEAGSSAKYLVLWMSVTACCAGLLSSDVDHEMVVRCEGRKVPVLRECDCPRCVQQRTLSQESA